MADIGIGSRVTRARGTGTATGKVTERLARRVSRTVEGTRITRNASPETSAFLIGPEDGARVLKSAREIEPG